jgi:hypothetical protein
MNQLVPITAAKFRELVAAAGEQDPRIPARMLASSSSPHRPRARP